MPSNVLDWLQQYLGGGQASAPSDPLAQLLARTGDPEAQASAAASQAMEPVVGPYLAKVASGDVIKESLDNVNAAFANHDYPALAGMFSGAGGGIRVYHGSPFDFPAEPGYPLGRFRSDKIGTGEGAQAKGYGLYFGEKEATGRAYRDQLSPYGVNIGGKFTEVNPSSADSIALANLQPFAKSPEPYALARQSLEALAGEAKPSTLQKAMDTLAYWEKQGAVPASGGKMYEAEINAEPGQFLNWDKPLNQQPEYVQNTLGLNKPTEFFETLTRRARHTGADYYQALMAPFAPIPLARLDAPRLASQQLNEAGIPGIRYLDQGSRAAGEGSSNYVVFNDQLVKILRKYGIVPPVAGGTLGGLLGEEPQ